MALIYIYYISNFYPILRFRKGFNIMINTTFQRSTIIFIKI
ncbi:hypothetical protein C3B79_1961 [Aeromonas hydrophila]|nr:hypothetical protein C3B79_1961 [Aeromonas hydrophila]